MDDRDGDDGGRTGRLKTGPGTMAAQPETDDGRTRRPQPVRRAMGDDLPLIEIYDFEIVASNRTMFEMPTMKLVWW